VFHERSPCLYRAMAALMLAQFERWRTIAYRVGVVRRPTGGKVPVPRTGGGSASE
jgi:hypothetical protein